MLHFVQVNDVVALTPAMEAHARTSSASQETHPPQSATALTGAWPLYSLTSRPPPLAWVMAAHEGTHFTCRIFHPLPRQPHVYSFTRHMTLPAAAFTEPPLFLPDLCHRQDMLRYCTSFALRPSLVGTLPSSITTSNPGHGAGPQYHILAPWKPRHALVASVTHAPTPSVLHHDFGTHQHYRDSVFQYDCTPQQYTSFIARMDASLPSRVQQQSSGQPAVDATTDHPPGFEQHDAEQHDEHHASHHPNAAAVTDLTAWLQHFSRSTTLESYDLRPLLYTPQKQRETPSQQPTRNADKRQRSRRRVRRRRYRHSRNVGDRKESAAL